MVYRCGSAARQTADSCQEVYKSLRKLGDIKADTHSQRLERRLKENGLAWGEESYVTS